MEARETSSSAVGAFSLKRGVLQEETWVQTNREGQPAEPYSAVVVPLFYSPFGHGNDRILKEKRDCWRVNENGKRTALANQRIMVTCDECYLIGLDAIAREVNSFFYLKIPIETQELQRSGIVSGSPCPAGWFTYQVLPLHEVSSVSGHQYTISSNKPPLVYIAR